MATLLMARSISPLLVDSVLTLFCLVMRPNKSLDGRRHNLTLLGETWEMDLAKNVARAGAKAAASKGKSVREMRRKQTPPRPGWRKMDWMASSPRRCASASTGAKLWNICTRRDDEQRQSRAFSTTLTPLKTSTAARLFVITIAASK